MSGGLGAAGLAAPAVVEEAVDKVDCAVAGRDPGATLRGRAGDVEGWVAGMEKCKERREVLRGR